MSAPILSKGTAFTLLSNAVTFLVISCIEVGADMTQTLSHLDKTIIQAGDTLKSIDKTYAEDSAMARELQTSIRELAEAARSLRILADYLERHPEALLRGKEAQ